MPVYGIKVKKKIMEEYFSGATGPALSEKYGIKARTIYNWGQLMQQEDSKLRKDIDMLNKLETLGSVETVEKQKSELSDLNDRVRAIEKTMNDIIEKVGIVNFLPSETKLVD